MRSVCPVGKLSHSQISLKYYVVFFLLQSLVKQIDQREEWLNSLLQVMHGDADILNKCLWWQIFFHVSIFHVAFDSWVGKIPWRRDRLPTPVFLGFPCGSAGKESACLGSIPGLGRERPPTPVFWPGEFHSLYSPWGCKDLDATLLPYFMYPPKPKI